MMLHNYGVNNDRDDLSIGRHDVAYDYDAVFVVESGVEVN